MTLLDLSLLIVLGGFILAGFWFGLVHMVGAFAGLIIGIWAAGHYEAGVAAWLSGLFGWNINLAHVIAFILIYTLAARLAGVAFWFLEKIFGFFTIIPFLKTFDRLLGAALGFVEGTFTIGLAVYFASRFPFSSVFTAALATSTYAAKFMAAGAFFAPLLPAAIQTLKSVIG